MASGPSPQAVDGWRDVTPSGDGWRDVDAHPAATPRKTPRLGLKGPDALEKSKSLEKDDSFMGTLTKDFAGVIPGVATAVAHPIDTAQGAFRMVKNLPADLEADLKQGKYGKLSARALEFILPGLSSAKIRAIAAAADAAAGRAAESISASGVPEAIGGEIKNSLTPDIVKRIRARLNPEPAAASKPQAPEPFRPNPRIAAKMKSGGPAEERYSPSNPIPRGKFTPPEAGPPPATPEPTPFPAGKGTAPGKAYPGPSQPQYGSAGAPAVRRGINRAMQPPASATGETVAAEGAAEAPKVEPEPATATPKAPFTNSAAARSVVARNMSLAKSMQGQLTAQQARMLSAPEWRALASKMGFDAPNKASQEFIIQQLELAQRMK